MLVAVSNLSAKSWEVRFERLNDCHVKFFLKFRGSPPFPLIDRHLEDSPENFPTLSGLLQGLVGFMH